MFLSFSSFEMLNTNTQYTTQNKKKVCSFIIIVNDQTEHISEPYHNYTILQHKMFTNETTSYTNETTLYIIIYTYSVHSVQGSQDTTT